MSIGLESFPKELLYDTHYQWIKREGNKVLFGLTPYGLEITGDVLYLSLPPVGTTVESGTTCGSLEAGKWVGRVYAPVSGKVTKVNEAVLLNPAIISHTPYNCWFVELEITCQEELKKLMTAADVYSWSAEDGRFQA